MSEYNIEKSEPIPAAMSHPADSTKVEHKRIGDVVLIPQPTDDPEDPLTWPMHKKILIFTALSLAAFGAQMSPNANQLTFVEQEPTYHKTTADLLNSVAAALVGWVVGPFLILPFVAMIGRSAVILYSLVGIFVCQIWGGLMTGEDDFVAFALSRFFAGLFGAIPAILGSGYIVDMFYLHQRGAAFAIFEVLIIFAVVGGGTLSGFIAQGNPWDYVFWWTLGPIGAAIVLVLFCLSDTTFDRRQNAPRRDPLPKGWVANRVATFLPGTRTQPPGKAAELVKRFVIPVQITFTPVTMLTGTYIFVALGLPIMQASTLAEYLAPPPAAGGYGFDSLRIACFTFTAWIGMIAAQVFGYFFNDKIPLWVARARGGIWHPEYRLANTLVPSILLPIALGIYGAGLQYHLNIMVLALGSFLIWFAALLALPVCYNYVVECFLRHPVEASVSLNAYRISFGILSVFVITDWQAATGVGWMWGMGAFFIILVDIIMVFIILGGHSVRQLTLRLNPSIANTEDGDKLFAGTRDAA